ncbi:MAG: protein-L-isoaspartate(D-aspartate) O-methyltransferase [Armatimonadetes bacterium]|nr:protein-L-isoaspartate(D-aspartate) O-methyltransferase [Armatimonadota bacterium]
MNRVICALTLSLFAAGVMTTGDDTPGASSRDEVPFFAARHRMVETQLKERGIAEVRVLAAMLKVPRHEFVPEEERDEAYEDRPLPIGEGQTISQPYIVAFMTEKLELGPEEKVLEIGTGSGYQTAILSELAREVYTIEIVRDLADRSAETLTRLGYDNLHARHGDGYEGWQEQAPFDCIIVTCAPTQIPKRLVHQLKEGGRLVIPVGEGYQQTLYLVAKEKGEAVEKAMLPVLFVPMTGEAVK